MNSSRNHHTAQRGANSYGEVLSRGGGQVVVPFYLRRRQAAAYCGVSLGTLDVWIRDRVLPVIRPSARTVLLRRTDIDRALDRFCVSAIGE